MHSDKEEQIIQLIKSKKELSGVSNSFIQRLLQEYLKKHNLSFDSLNFHDFNLIKKEIRSEMRLFAGRFKRSIKIKNPASENKTAHLLYSHSSTFERLSFYPELKKIISSLNVKSILDLACGLNPLALAEPEYKYYAADINEYDLDTIKEFFKKNKIKGAVFVHDLSNLDSACSLPKVDLVLLFKVLDIIEKKNHKIAEFLIKNLNCRHILISFPTKKLSGKPMNCKRRIWLEKLLRYNSFKYRVFLSENEIFYLVQKII